MPAAKPVKLPQPRRFDEAMKALMNVEPEPREKKKSKKRPAKKKSQ